MNNFPLSVRQRDRYRVLLTSLLPTRWRGMRAVGWEAFHGAEWARFPGSGMGGVSAGRNRRGFRGAAIGGGVSVALHRPRLRGGGWRFRTLRSAGSEAVRLAEGAASCVGIAAPASAGPVRVAGFPCWWLRRGWAAGVCRSQVSIGLGLLRYHPILGSRVVWDGYTGCACY